MFSRARGNQALTESPPGRDGRPLGGVRREDHGHDPRTARRSHGASAPPDSQKPNVDKRAFRTAGPKGPLAPSRWIRNVNDYDRRQPREYAVTRFG
jgi:hypothetical protein